MLRQQLQQKLLQKLSPQQIQLMKLLQLPALQLEQRIKQEIEENPALEAEEDADFDDENIQNEYDQVDNQSENQDDTEGDNEQVEESVYDDDSLDIDENYDDDIADYNLYQNNNPEESQTAMPFSSVNSFRESLISQLGYKDLQPDEYLIGEQLIGNIDDAGYLQRELSSITDDLAFYQNIHVKVEDVSRVLDVIQDMEPPGVGARNLRECLLIQLRRLDDYHDIKDIAMTILQKYFEEFSKKHYEKIIHKTGITQEQLSAVITLIQKLNPKPGNSTTESEQYTMYIIPDFIIEINNDELELTLNKGNVPELRVSRMYMDMLQDYSKAGAKISEQQKQATVFLKQKLDSAKWFIDAVKQRHNTLYVTMKAIMDYQKKYFLSGDETLIKPMILKDIADIVKLDISTVSRVANSKYVQTPYGTFLLKTFFSESLSTESGEEVSSREVKKILEDCIENEDKRKPLTDDQLAKILKLKGYNIARRTIAKYRELLGIPVARLRKEL